jgi:hypothetical protein
LERNTNLSIFVSLNQSTNKKALTRYLAYDRCLRNTGAKYTWQRLKDEANKALLEEGLEGIGKTIRRYTN